MAQLRSTSVHGDLTVADSVKGKDFTGGVWNDYAEFRQCNEFTPGKVVVEVGDGSLELSTQRLQPGAKVISDTYGFSIGKNENNQCPVAVAGRVLVYILEGRNNIEPGDVVCASPNGLASKMTREEIREWPDRILGIVSEIPTYTKWGDGEVDVDGRIWICVK